MPVEKTANFIRVRVASPKLFLRFRVKMLGKGIKAVIGFKKGGGSKIQSVLFPRSRYTLAQAKAWVKSHGYQASETAYYNIFDFKPEFFTSDDVEDWFVEETITDEEGDPTYRCEHMDEDLRKRLDGWCPLCVSDKNRIPQKTTADQMFDILLEEQKKIHEGKNPYFGGPSFITPAPRYSGSPARIVEKTTADKMYEVLNAEKKKVHASGNPYWDKARTTNPFSSKVAEPTIIERDKMGAIPQIKRTAKNPDESGFAGSLKLPKGRTYSNSSKNVKHHDHFGKKYHPKGMHDVNSEETENWTAEEIMDFLGIEETKSQFKIVKNKKTGKFTIFSVPNKGLWKIIRTFDTEKEAKDFLAKKKGAGTK